MSWPADATMIHKHVLTPGDGPGGVIGTSLMACGKAALDAESDDEAWVNDDWPAVTCLACQAAMPRPIAILLGLLPPSLRPGREQVERWLAS